MAQGRARPGDLWAPCSPRPSRAAVPCHQPYQSVLRMRGRVPVKDYGVLLSQGRAQALVAVAACRSRACSTELGCLQTALGSGLRRGYSTTNLVFSFPKPDGSLEQRELSFSLHRVAFVAAHGRDVAPGMVASHLCGNRACFLAAHITEETQAANLLRAKMACPGTLRVRYPGGERVVRLCSHEPRCLREQVV